MSLEQALADNTAALKALTAALASSPKSLAPSAQPVTPALSTAAVPPPPTAPEVAPAISPPPTSAFAQAAATSVAPVTPAAPPTGNPAVDANGIPWDGRIHASSKALVADGSWRMKRGVDAALVAQVTGELRAAAGAPPAPQVTAASTPWPFDTSPADVAPPPPPPAVSQYATLMSRLTGCIVAGTVTQQQITDACVALGVPNVAALAGREDLVPSVALALGVTL